MRGVVLSLDAQPGTHTTAGTSLAQLADCGRAFLILLPGREDLHAGESVQVNLPPLPPFVGTVRASTGVAEPADALVVGPYGHARHSLPGPEDGDHHTDAQRRTLSRTGCPPNPRGGEAGLPPIVTLRARLPERCTA